MGFIIGAQGGGGGSAWSGLTSATGNLLLNNSAYTTEFDQSTAAQWTWKNATAATYSGLATPTLLTSSTATSSPVTLNTTGATLIVIPLSVFYTNNLLATVVDNQNNEWYYTNLYAQGPEAVRVAYCFAPVTSASHTFTLTAVWPVCGVIYVFNGTVGNYTVYDSAVGRNVNSPGATTFQIASLTPAAGDVVISCFSNGNASAPTTVSIDSGFATPIGMTGGSCSGAASYLIGASGAALNPTWTFSPSGSSLAGVNICFKAAPNVVSQSSPILTLSGNYWNGSASAADLWTIQNAIPNNQTNPPSVLKLAHSSGSSGGAAVQVPQINIGSTDTGLSRLSSGVLALGNGVAGDYSGALQTSTLQTGMLAGIGSNSVTIAGNYPLVIDQNFATGNSNFQILCKGQYHQSQFQLGTETDGLSVGLYTMQGALRLISGSGNPKLSVNTYSGITPSTGTTVLFSIGGDPAYTSGFLSYSGYSGKFIACEIQPSINMLSGSTGNFTALGVYPYIISQQNGPNYLACFGTSSALGPSATLTNVTTIDTSGNIATSGTMKSAGVILNRATKSANYTTNATDYLIVYTSTPFTLTLDSGAAVAGTTYKIKVAAAATGASTVTVAPNNAKTIDSAASTTVAIGAYITVCYDGSSNWDIV